MSKSTKWFLIILGILAVVKQLGNLVSGHGVPAILGQNGEIALGEVVWQHRPDNRSPLVCLCISQVVGRIGILNQLYRVGLYHQIGH